MIAQQCSFKLIIEASCSALLAPAWRRHLSLAPQTGLATESPSGWPVIDECAPLMRVRVFTHNHNISVLDVAGTFVNLPLMDLPDASSLLLLLLLLLSTRLPLQTMPQTHLVRAASQDEATRAPSAPPRRQQVFGCES